MILLSKDDHFLFPQDFDIYSVASSKKHNVLSKNNVLSKKYNKNDFVLYRDDGLAVLKNKIKQNTQKILKEHGLDIIRQCNMKVVNYLDLTYD